MKKTVLGLTAIAVGALLFALLACSPTPTTSQPAPAKTPTEAPTPKPTQATSPDDAAWAKVIEAAKKEGKVSIYAFNYTGDTGTAIARAFEDRYGVKADIITGRGAEFVERVKTEQRVGQRVGDVFEGSVAHNMNMKNQGLLTSSLDLPVLKSKSDFLIDPTGIDKDGFILNEAYILYSPYINTTQVKPGQEPKSWNDFLDPKWKGKILANDPQISVTWYNAIVPLVRTGVFKIDLIQQVGKQGLLFGTGDYDVVQKLSQGQAPLSMISPDIVTSAAAAAGAPIKAIPMAEGVTASTTAISNIKDPPHPNAARLFINWLLSAEGQTAFHKAQSNGSIRKDIPDFRHPNTRVSQDTKLVIVTKEDADESTKEFNAKYYIELWKK